MGPLSSKVAADRFEDQLKRAVAGGATLVGGERDGNYFSAGVLTGVTPDNIAHHEELFGPVAIVYKVKDEGEAVTLANDTPFGLGAAVFGRDLARAGGVAARIEAGMVGINQGCGGADGSCSSCGRPRKPLKAAIIASSVGFCSSFTDTDSVWPL